MWPVEDWLGSVSHRLSSHRQFDAESATAAHRHILRISGGDCFLFVKHPGRFAALGGSQTRLADTRIQFLKFESNSECETSILRSADRHILLHIPVRGEFEATQGDSRTIAKVGQLLVVGSAGETHRRWDGASELLNIAISRDAFARVLMTDFLVEVGAPIEFHRLELVELNHLPAVTSLIETIVADLVSGFRLFQNPIIGQQAEKMLIMLILKTIPNSYLDALNAPAATAVPFYVRRAEQHMRARMAESVTMQTLCGAAGVSPRTLYYGFKRYRAQTPMKYLKRLRLSSARTMLTNSRPVGAKICDIARQVGYTRVSQFSRDYKTQFGENPSVTGRGETYGNHPRHDA